MKREITEEDPVTQIMTAPVISIDADECVYDAHKLMRERGISSLLVTCTADNKVRSHALRQAHGLL